MPSIAIRKKESSHNSGHKAPAVKKPVVKKPVVKKRKRKSKK